MKILFISRAYPPIIGGIENQNYELGRWLSKIAEVKVVANKYGKKFLPFFLPYAIFYTLLNLRKYDVLLLGDAVLFIVAWKIKFCYKKPIICVTHGLDLTFKNFFYQKLWIGLFSKKIDKFIAVGNETVKVAKEKGIAPEKISFIPNGVDIKNFLGNYQRAEIKKIIGEPIENKKFILTSGRLAKRKGVAWFCKNVMPKLPENIIYIVVGDGSDKNNIQAVVKKNNLQNRVKILGYISDKKRNILFKTCDLFVQPNIKIPDDMEGFGISVIEAALCKIPVIASRLEGLQDAIIDGKNGFLAESENAEQWIKKINAIFSAGPEFRKSFGKKARDFVIENYSWEKISQKYLNEIEKTKSSK